jgi:hypothetical protein
LKKHRLLAFWRKKKVLKKQIKEQKEAQKKLKASLKGNQTLENAKKIVASALVFSTIFTAINLYPVIKQALIQKAISSMPVEIHAPTETLTPPAKNSEGEIIESVDDPKELVNAYDFLEDKFLGDADYFGIDLESINFIKGIYKIDLASENFAKDFAIQVIVNTSGKDIIFEYTGLEENFKDGFNVDTTVNSTGTILSFSENLAECYPSNVVEQDEQKIELAEKIKEITGNNCIIGDPIVFSENAVSSNYQIPVYQNNSCILYSIKESVLADNSEDISYDAIMSLLSDYIEQKNKLFEVKTIEQIKESNSIYYAINAAISDAELNS